MKSSARVELFRTFACELPGAEEKSHMGSPDFRVHGRIFATLSGQARGRGVLKLTPDQQAQFVAELPQIFEPVQGGWGRMGMTYVVLEKADNETMRGALKTAYHNVEQREAATRATTSGRKARLKSTASRKN